MFYNWHKANVLQSGVLLPLILCEVKDFGSKKQQTCLARVSILTKENKAPSLISLIISSETSSQKLPNQLYKKFTIQSI